LTIDLSALSLGTRMIEWQTTINPAASGMSLHEAGEVEAFLNDTTSATPFQENWFQMTILGGSSRRLVICRRNAHIVAFGIGVVAGSRAARILGFRGLEFQKGPVIKDPALSREILHQIATAAKDAGFVYVVAQPQFENDDATTFESLAEAAGWTRENGPLFATMKLDLRDGDAALLSRMKSDTRRRIKGAAIMGINARFASANDVDTIYALYDSTAKRKKFSVLDPGSFSRMCNAILDNTSLGCILVAEFQDRLIGAIVVIRTGPVAHYVYGATGNQGLARNLPIAYPLHYRATLWARREGCTHYDMGGFDISRTISVSQFKAGFRGDIFRFPAQHSINLVPLARHVRRAETLLRNVRKLAYHSKR
jgi:hypothetical protein